jgi:hypothetical protein
MSLGHGTGIVRNGLLLQLDPANIKSYSGSGTIIYDLAGNGNYGTLTNGPLFSSLNNGQIVCDGVNDYIVYSDSTVADNLASMTVSAWVNTNWFASGTYIPIIEKFPDEVSGSGWELALNWTGTPSIFAMLQDTGGAHWNSEYVPITGLLPTGSYWLNIGFSYSGGTTGKILLYINGKKQSTVNASSGVVGSISTTSRISIASRDGKNNYGSNFSSMALGLVKVYNRQLTDLEIKQNFEALRGRYGI